MSDSEDSDFSDMFSDQSDRSSEAEEAEVKVKEETRSPTGSDKVAEEEGEDFKVKEEEEYDEEEEEDDDDRPRKKPRHGGFILDEAVLKDEDPWEEGAEDILVKEEAEVSNIDHVVLDEDNSGSRRLQNLWKEVNGEVKLEPNVKKERPQKRGGGRFEPYGNPSKRYRVFVSNIKYGVKWQALKDLMKEKVGEVTYVKYLLDAEGISRGCAVVEFRTEELMKKAVEKVNKHELKGRPLNVREDPDGVIAQRDARRASGGGGGGPPGSHGGMNMGGNMNMGMNMGRMGMDRMNVDRMGMDRMGMDRMNVDRMGPGPGAPPMVNRGAGAGGPGPGGLPGRAARKGCQIFVRNLPFDCTWKLLKDTFNTCGMVRYADIVMENGKSNGCGVVRFNNPETAERACRSMNGYWLNGRQIDVRIDGCRF